MLHKDERHELLEDGLLVRSQTWKLSTSGLSAGDQFRGTGFGSPEWGGYGVSCGCHLAMVSVMLLITSIDLPGPEIMKFGIESKHSCPETSTRVFKEALATALLDMRALCLTATQAHL